jgi:RNA polymerase sigma-70 factor, ECF subfamily
MVVAEGGLIRQGGPKTPVMSVPFSATTRFERGEPVDLEQIFRAHQKEIYVYFLRTTGNRHRAEDLGQETFARACSAAVLFRGDSSVRTWLFSIARRVMVDDIRRRGPASAPLENESPGPAGDPSDRVAIEQALREIPVSSREAIVLCDVLGLSPSEAAEITGLNANAFRVRLHRARGQFREVYGDDR